MEQLVNDVDKMTSLVISELTGKRHSDVISAIKKMESSWVKLGQRSFSFISYKDSQNRVQPMYELSKTESLYIATKFNDEARAKLILRWEALESEKQSKLRRLPSKKELALMVVDAEERAERLQLEIETKHIPRSQFVDQVFNSDALITMSQAAKSLGLGFGRNTLFKKLREKGILFKSSNEPKQQYVDSGYFEIKEKMFSTPTGDKIKIQTYVTQKGLGYIAKIFKVVQLPVNEHNKAKFISA